MTVPDGLSPTEEDGTDGSLAGWAAEFADRLHGGEPAELEAYIREHPERAEQVQRLVSTIRMLDTLTGSWEDPAQDGAAVVGESIGILGDFRLVREVGRGGMGIVYAAIQLSLNRQVALKVLPFAAALDPRQLQRFQAEAQVVARLHHNHIVPVFVTGSERGVPYYAMQFIEGRDLAELIRERRSTGRSASGREDFRSIAELGRQAAEALEFAHANDVLHRDIKPSNLMVDGEGHLWITDFGLARVRGELDLTRTGDLPGTPRYMSPEQALGRRGTIDGRSDLYSLGVTLYELLAGVPAFAGDDRQVLLTRIVREDPRPISALNARVPADLETIVMKAMAKDPSDRYATAREAADDLGRYLEGLPIRARRPTRLGRALKWSRRHQRFVLAGALATFLVAAAVTATAWWSNALLRGYNARLQAEIARADRHAREADTHRRTAESRQKLADRLLYLANLKLAGQALQFGQIERAQDILRDAAAGTGGAEFRAFSWHYLWRTSRREVIAMRGPGEQISQLALSSRGRDLVSVDSEGTLALWDTIAERPRVRLTRVGETASLPVFSPDGRCLAALVRDGPHGRDPRAVVWDVGSGRRLATLRPDAPGLDAEIRIDFLADGRVLGIRSRPVDPARPGAVVLWDLDPAVGPGRRAVHLGAMRHAAFASCGPAVLTQHDDRLVVRDPVTGTPRVTVAGNFSGAGPWAVSPDGRHVAGALPGRGVVFWDAETGEETGGDDLAGPILIMMFNADGSTLALLDEKQQVHLLDRSSGRRLILHPDDLDRERIVRYVFSPDGSRLATTSYGWPGGQRPVIVWDVATGTALRRFPGRDDRVGGMGFSGDGRLLYVDGGAMVRAWRMEPDDPPSPAGHADEAWAVAFSPDGRTLASGSDDSADDPTIKLWDAETARLVKAWRGHPGTVSALAFRPDGRRFASASLSQVDNLKIWETATGLPVATLRGHTQFVRSVAFSPDGSTVASGGSDRTVRLWDAETGEPRFVREDHGETVRHVAFAPGGRVLASAGNDGTVRLWDVATGRPLHVMRVAEKVAALAFTPEGRTVAAADESGQVTLWDVAAGTLNRVIRAENDDLRCLAISPDGRNLAAAGLSRTIRLWDLATGQEALTLVGHEHQINSLSFSPRGDSLASCSHDGVVRIWRAAEKP